MGNIKQVLNFINENPILAIIAGWLVYRFGIWSERKNILLSLPIELEIHAWWFNQEYKVTKIEDINYFVFKVATTTLDNAIIRGSVLFINSGLIEALITYKQKITSFNQLVDSAQSFYSNSDLHSSSTEEKLKKHMTDLIQDIHVVGIGSSTTRAAYSGYTLLMKEIEKERNLYILPFIWTLTGINLFKFKEFIYKYF